MSHKINQIQKGKWIEIEQPTKEDLELLKKEFPQFHPTNLEDSMQRVSRAKLDLIDDYLFMSLIVPMEMPQGQRTKNFEASIFLTKEAVVTITHEKTDIFRQEQQEKDVMAEIVLPSTPDVLAYRFLEAIYDTSAQTIDSINKAITVIDHNILNIRSSKTIRDISILQRNIIYFITTLKASIPYIHELEQKNVKFGTISMREYWGDLLDKLRLQRDLLEDYDNLLTKLSKAHENYLTYHTNHVINLLTIISVILLPLNLIAGIYGMNFDFLPAANHPSGFFLTLIFMGLIALIMILCFKYKKWI